MARYNVTVMTPASKIALALMGIALIVILTGPLWMGRADMRLAVEIACYLTLATMWNLLAGYAGLVSIGQQAFVGIGGYALFAGVILGGLNPLVGLLLAGVLAGCFALPTAALAFRLKGAYYAIGTWVIAEVYMLLTAQISLLGGGSGMSLPAKAVREIASGRAERDMIIYYIAVSLAVISIAMVYGLLRSRHGLALTAIRDSETASASVGVNNTQIKYIIYISTAIMTGFAGGLIFLSKLRISPDAAFNVVDWTAYVIFIVVIGGIGRIEGPIVGTIVFFLLRGFFADLGSIYLILLGALAVIVMLKAPQGLWGLLLDKFGVEIFPVQRRLVPRNDP